MYLSKERKKGILLLKEIGLLKHGFHAWVNGFRSKPPL